MARVDRFVQDVGVPPAKTGNFLGQAFAGLRHEIVPAPIPQFVSTDHRIRYPTAGCLHNVFAHWLRIIRRQLAMPVDGGVFFLALQFE